jgi:hypothetical protein
MAGPCMNPMILVGDVDLNYDMLIVVRFFSFQALSAQLCHCYSVDSYHSTKLCTEIEQ